MPLHRVHERIVGAACLLLAIILFLPIPFGNIPQAFALAAFALGILDRDGVATLGGWLATAGSLLILAAVSSAIIAGICAFLDQLWVLIGEGFQPVLRHLLLNNLGAAPRAPECLVLELAIVAFLIVLNGLFSLSELAIVSSRKARLKTMAEAGRAGATTALALAEDPGRFLSTVQIGITLVGILAGAYSCAALGNRLGDILIGYGLSEGVAEPLGYGLVVAIITYLSVVIGELVPKNLALSNTEGIACAVAPMMAMLSKVAAPVVWLLDASTRLVFRLLGRSTASDSAVTEEEIRTIVAEAETAGVIETDERKMIAGVLRLGDRAVRGIMTPRTDVDWIDLDDPEFEIRERLINSPHSRLPVAEGHPDNMLGVVQARELLAASLRDESLDIRKHIRKAPIIPDTLDALDALEVLRKAEVPMALVHDEYGHFDGVVTPADIIDAIAGAFRSDEGEAEPEAVQREDGSWLLAGWMPADEMAEQLGIPLPERRNYETVAGLVIGELQHLPNAGEAVETLGWRFEVVDMDGRRIDKVLAQRIDEQGVLETQSLPAH